MNWLQDSTAKPSSQMIKIIGEKVGHQLSTSYLQIHMTSYLL
jgi:hypothetical protein